MYVLTMYVYVCTWYYTIVVESQQKWSSYEVNSRILDNNYLWWYLFYLNKRTKDSTARTLPQEVSINSIDLAILFFYRNFSVNAVFYTDLWPSHQIRATYRQMHFWRCIFSLSKSQQLLFYLYLFTIFPWHRNIIFGFPIFQTFSKCTFY